MITNHSLVYSEMAQSFSRWVGTENVKQFTENLFQGEYAVAETNDGRRLIYPTLQSAHYSTRLNECFLSNLR